VTNTPSTSPPQNCPPPQNNCFPQQSNICYCYTLTNTSNNLQTVFYTECAQTYPVTSTDVSGFGTSTICAEQILFADPTVTITQGCYCCADGTGYC
jgi:hypothetical protein